MQRKIEMLVVEDNPGDVRLIEEALRGTAVARNVHFAADGMEAMSFLASSPEPPRLVLLDLSLPRKTGHEVLREMREHPVLREVPVVVFSSSSREEDIAQAYGYGANCYITKPPELDKYFETIQRVDSFWLS